MSFPTNVATINEISHLTTDQQQNSVPKHPRSQNNVGAETAGPKCPRSQNSLAEMPTFSLATETHNGTGYLLTIGQRQIDQNTTEQNVSKFGAVSCANCLKEKAKNEKMHEQLFQRQEQMLAKIDELQKSVFALKEGQSSIVSAVEKQFSSLCTKLDNKINDLQNSSTALIGVQKDMQKSVNRFIGPDYSELTKMYSNCWDAAACHINLVVSDSASNNAAQNKAQRKSNNSGILPTLPGYVRKSVVVKHNGKNSGFCSVFAKMSIPNGSFFYYEVTILHKHYDFGMHIGIATKQMPLHSCVGCHEGSYAYDDNGKFLGSGALLDGTSGRIGSLYYDDLFSAGTSGQSKTAAGSSCDSANAIDGTPSLDVGDVVGCGVNRVSGRITYTLNGRHLGSVNVSANASSVELFPCVSLCWPGDKIDANFGPIFKYPEGSYKI
ncbi:hypothetical protein niasHS_001784 [Heterodera schachtii]|uniref:B30.2/SPRY domain-containing protein n=1 Tax=Heterodera schachtii TaxID=97005 RepID=A0ABD2K1I7_HETSC